jgi:hypothetical protein
MLAAGKNVVNVSDETVSGLMLASQLRRCRLGRLVVVAG